jgi:CRISPR-associated protein Cas1
MGTLYVDRRGSSLDFERGALVIREPDAPPRSVPLALVERLVVIGNVKLTSGLLTKLADNGTAMAFLPGRGQQRSAFLLGEGHGDAVRRLGQYRMATDLQMRGRLASQLVRLRLAGQQRLLRTALRYRADQRFVLLDAVNGIGAAREALATYPMGLGQIRGQEGAAAAAFFRGYGALFPESAGFTGRNRRPPRDPVNASLSLGYTLAHGDALRAIAATGLDPAIGLYHQPAWSRESLACALVELARARVERFVWRLFADRIIRPENFTRSGEGVRLAKGARESFFATWEHQAGVHRRWQARAARFLARECHRLGQGIATMTEIDEPPF